MVRKNAGQKISQEFWVKTHRFAEQLKTVTRMNEPHRKQRGIVRSPGELHSGFNTFLTAPRGGVLNPSARIKFATPPIKGGDNIKLVTNTWFAERSANQYCNQLHTVRLALPPTRQHHDPWDPAGVKGRQQTDHRGQLAEFLFHGALDEQNEPQECPREPANQQPHILPRFIQ